MRVYWALTGALLGAFVALGIVEIVTLIFGAHVFYDMIGFWVMTICLVGGGARFGWYAGRPSGN